MFPHIVSGGGFTTQLMLFSGSGSAAAGRLWFMSGDGVAQPSNMSPRLH
jgi:hypothetical protein